MTVRRFVSNSSRETIAIGGEIAHMLQSPTLLFLRGDLGAGKTTLVKGIAQALDAIMHLFDAIELALDD